MAKINPHWLVMAFLLVGLLADLMPHPILGDSMLTSTVNYLFVRDREEF